MRTWLALLVLCPVVASAQEAAIAAQGRLLSASGVPYEGAVTVAFSLMTAPVDGTPVLTRTESLTVSDGYYSVILSGINGQAFDGDRWMGLVVDGEELLPRQPIHAVAQALHASGARLRDVAAPCDATTSGLHGTLRFHADRFEGCTPGGWSPLTQ